METLHAFVPTNDEPNSIEIDKWFRSWDRFWGKYAGRELVIWVLDMGEAHGTDLEETRGSRKKVSKTREKKVNEGTA